MKSAKFWDWFAAEAEPKLDLRAPTFRRMFEYLDTVGGPVVIVETGCCREKDNWAGDGQSTIIFDHYAQTHPLAHVQSVDIDAAAVKYARSVTSGKTTVHTKDSVQFLRSIAETTWFPSLVYLDSFDLQFTDPIPSALHHLQELYAILPAIRRETLVVVDDSPQVFDGLPSSGTQPGGKGLLVAEYARQYGAEMLFAEYQTGWTHMHRREIEREDLREFTERARAHVEAKEGVAADTLYRRVLQMTQRPTRGLERVARGEACLFFAREALSKVRFGTAGDWYREALVADPYAIDYRIEFVVKVLLASGDLKQAQFEATKATKIAPKHAGAWRCLGGIEHELGNIDACIAAYDEALRLLPDSAVAMLDRAAIALDVEDYAYGKRLAQAVLTTDLKADACNVLAMIAHREAQHHEAIRLFDEALAGGCYNQPITHWHKSLSLHAIGDYKNGWIEHEHRRDVTSKPAMSMPVKRFVTPMWQGESAPARIHVHHEAGDGDNLCLVRYFRRMLNEGYDVRYETQPRLVSLIQRSFPDVQVMPRAPDYPNGLGIPLFDYHVPIGSLPAVFGTEVHTIPQNVPYLKAEPELIKAYRRQLPFGHRIVGLCWSSGLREGLWIRRYGSRKSMKLRDLIPLMNRYWGDRFVSLQVGPEREELAEVEDVLDLLPAIPTWDDTAALASCCDEVITVDTAVSHLCGGLGISVRLAMHTQGSWHYMADIDGAPWQHASPWYPNTKLYRQTDENRWDDVVERIAEALAEPIAEAAD